MLIQGPQELLQVRARRHDLIVVDGDELIWKLLQEPAVLLLPEGILRLGRLPRIMDAFKGPESLS